MSGNDGTSTVLSHRLSLMNPWTKTFKTPLALGGQRHERECSAREETSSSSAITTSIRIEVKIFTTLPHLQGPQRSDGRTQTPLDSNSKHVRVPSTHLPSACHCLATVTSHRRRHMSAKPFPKGAEDINTNLDLSLPLSLQGSKTDAISSNWRMKISSMMRRCAREQGGLRHDAPLHPQTPNFPQVVTACTHAHASSFASILTVPYSTHTYNTDVFRLQQQQQQQHGQQPLQLPSNHSCFAMLFVSD